MRPPLRGWIWAAAEGSSCRRWEHWEAQQRRFPLVFTSKPKLGEAVESTECPVGSYILKRKLIDKDSEVEIVTEL